MLLQPFVLPFPPSANTYYRSVRMGAACRVLLSKNGREYKTCVKEYIKDYTATIEPNPFPYSGRLAVHIMLHAPTRRKFDLDNMAKPILDSLEESGIYENDNLIDSLVLRRGEIHKGEGKAIVQVSEVKLSLARQDDLP